MRFSTHLQLFAGSQGRVLADVSARIWSAIISFAVMPIYLSYLGTESFGIVSTFASLQAILALMDCSLSPSLTRELARASAVKHGWEKAKDLSRTMEISYWGLAFLAGGILIACVPIISNDWLNPKTLSPVEIREALYLGAIGLICQWPSTLYAGGLAGLQKQKLMAVINVSIATSRAAITILCLWMFPPTVLTIFIVGIAVGLTQSLVMRLLFWRSMPNFSIPGHFQAGLIKEIWKFAVGLSVITITTVIILQTDKIILSRLLPLSEFGIYTISISIASALYIVSGAFFGVNFPKLCELVAANDQAKLISFYHKACQSVSILVFPAGAVIFFFSSELLLLWTKNTNVAQQGHKILSIYVVGSVLNCMLSIPYAAQLAFGHMRVVIITNLLCLALAFPLIYFLFQTFGSLSGAITWCFINFILLSTTAYVTNKRFSRSEARKWYIFDIGLPLISSFAAIAVFRLLIPELKERLYVSLGLTTALILGSACALLVTPDARRRFLDITKFRKALDSSKLI